MAEFSGRDVREEKEIFSELTQVCSFPGYVHVIAYFCFRDNMLKYSDNLTVDDVLCQLSSDSLSRTEISTLIGLVCKNLDISKPSPSDMQSFIDKTEILLKEVHNSLLLPMKEVFELGQTPNQISSPFAKGSIFREAIFYGGDSAYRFQYRDLSLIKYQKDSAWLLCNKGFSIDQAINVITAIQSFQSDCINNIFPRFREIYPNDWDFLEAFKFSVEEISSSSGIEFDVVKQVIETFVAPNNNEKFNSLDDFNLINAYPIIKLSNNKYLLLQNYNLVEALYETPFYWFCADKPYRACAMQNRGDFVEKFSADRLKLVFGSEHVFQNVKILDLKNNNVGEIDVLVVFANRALVLQAKSKKLTIEARKGNDNSLKNDFMKSVQDAYDQAFMCSTFLTDKNYLFIDENDNELVINRKCKEIYPICVVSDHYPALSFQCRFFLSYQEKDYIKPPFVMDVFFLDVLTEMLQSPLYLLSYVRQRTSYDKKILSAHELSILAYHLKNNLWISDEFNLVLLGNEVSADLDLAMMTRRDGAPGIKIPSGILTEYKGTFFDQIITDIDKLADPDSLELGLMLLTLGSKSIESINDGISHLINLGEKDGKHHDFVLGFSEGNTGLTVHCNNDPDFISKPRLEHYCELRKYKEKADSWFGICIGQTVPRFRFCVTRENDWVQSNEMDEFTKTLPEAVKSDKNKKVKFKTESDKARKIGRNDKCPCGSGKKYKKCCLS